MFSLTVLDFFEYFLSAIVLTVGVLYVYYKHCYNYWAKRGVPTIKPKFPFGNIFNTIIGAESQFTLIENLYNEAKAKNYKHLGLYYFNGPVYLPIDHEIIKSILVTDFNSFADRGSYMDEKKHPLTLNILSMPVQQWKGARAKLTPMFNGAKLKGMFETFEKHIKILLNVIEPSANGRDNVNLKEILRNFSIDVIASTALGLESNTQIQPDSELVQMINRIFSNSRWRIFLTMLDEGLQKPGKIFKVIIRDKVVEDYFTNLIKTNMKYREENDVIREDLFNNLLEQKKKNNISVAEVLGESWLFFNAGFDTLSSTMTTALHELAHNQKLQDKVRKEIIEKIGRTPTKYDLNDIGKLSLLEKIIKGELNDKMILFGRIFAESLRKYPPAPLLFRESTKKYQVPGTDVELEKGTPVIISVASLHRQPEFYPEPNKFDPSRFDDDRQIHPGTFIPFGDGPRNCIGVRFAMTEMKLALASLLVNYRFSPSPDTPYNFENDPEKFLVTFVNKYPVYTKVEKLT